MKKLFKLLFWGALLIGFGAITFISAKTGSTQTSDKFAYLPSIHFDPTLTPTPSPSPTPTCSYQGLDSADEDVENAILDAIHKVRAQDGQSRLVQLRQLTDAARLHSRDMAENNYVGHQDSNIKYGPDRLAAVCYIIAEDQEVVWGGKYSDFENADALVAFWMTDSDSRGAILDDDMVDVGVGYFRGVDGSAHEDYVTLTIGRRK